MSGQALLHNIGNKNTGFDVWLTANYYLTVGTNIVKVSLESVLDRLNENVLFRVEEITLLLLEVYRKSKDIGPEEATIIHPMIVKLRRTITKQNKRYSSISYGRSDELRKSFLNLVRLVNRIEARLQKEAYKNNVSVETPSYIKERMAENGKQIIKNALLQEANH